MAGKDGDWKGERGRENLRKLKGGEQRKDKRIKMDGETRT